MSWGQVIHELVDQVGFCAEQAETNFGEPLPVPSYTGKNDCLRKEEKDKDGGSQGVPGAGIRVRGSTAEEEGRSRTGQSLSPNIRQARNTLTRIADEDYLPVTERVSRQSVDFGCLDDTELPLPANVAGCSISGAEQIQQNGSSDPRSNQALG